MSFRHLINKFLSIILSFSLISSQILLAIETIPNNLPSISIDSSLQPNNPTLDKSRNNIDIINISTPNEIGISNNYFKEFNVNKEGLIFNNSKDLITPTELAGLIHNNPHLKDKEASLILNQITGNHISELLGFMEIAGKRADLIIANPNGISCQGCGFINSSSSTLTTGSVSLEELNRLNDLKDLNNHLNIMVQRGHINIEALNSSNIPTLNLISRSLKVKGDVLANKLNIILGTNKVELGLKDNASVLLYEPIEIPNDSYKDNPNNLNDNSSPNQSNNKDETTSKTKIALALDVAYLGSMVAKSIYLVATDKGIGVKNSGRIATIASEQVGDGGFLINVNGKVEIAKPKEAYEEYQAQQDYSNNDDNTNHTTLDTPNSNFIPPSIIANKDLSIRAEELEKVNVGRTHHYSWCEEEGRESDECGSRDNHNIYDYDKIITEDHLKAGTYDPAFITAKNIYIKGNSFTNDTAILYAKENTKLEAENIINTQPIPKRVEKKVGVMEVYNRLTHCILWIKTRTTCRSTTDTYDYSPSPSISSIALELPNTNLDSIISNSESLNKQTFSSAPLDYVIENNPLYTSKENFISTDEFKSHLRNSFILSHPLQDFTGIMNSMNKNIQEGIASDVSSNNNILAPSDSYDWIDANNPNNVLASNDTDASDLNDTSSDNNKDNQKSKNSNKTSNSRSSTSNDETNSTPTQKTKIKALGIYGKDIAFIATDTKNSSNIKGGDVFINSKFLLNQNGSIVANHFNETNDTSNQVDIAKNNSNNTDVLYSQSDNLANNTTPQVISTYLEMNSKISALLSKQRMLI